MYDYLGWQHHHHKKSPTEYFLSCGNQCCTSLSHSQFWWAVIESILTSSITLCFFFRSKTQQVSCSTEVTGCHLPSVELLYIMRASNKVQRSPQTCFILDTIFYHPADDGSLYLQELPVNISFISFIPKVVHLFNGLMDKNNCTWLNLSSRITKSHFLFCFPLFSSPALYI